ncbi:MAG: DNA translocase FtsK 4TM domain-containing protein [Polyangiaceae bacterium]
MGVSLFAPRRSLASDGDGSDVVAAEAEAKPARRRSSATGAARSKASAPDKPSGDATTPPPRAARARSAGPKAAPTASPKTSSSAVTSPGAPATGSGAGKLVHGYAREASALLLLASALYVTLALASFAGDPMRPEVSGADWVGPVGAAFAGALVQAVGACAWLVPLDLALFAAPLLKARRSKVTFVRVSGDLVVLVVASALLHVAFPASTAFGAMPLGGGAGELFGEVMRALFSTLGSYIVGLTVVSLILIGRAAFSIIDWAQRAERRAKLLRERGEGGIRALVGAWDQARALDEQLREEERKASEPLITEACDEAIVAALGDDSPSTFPRVKPLLATGGSGLSTSIGALVTEPALGSLATPSLARGARAEAPTPLPAARSALADARSALADARAEAPTPTPAALASEKKRGRRKTSNDPALAAAALAGAAAGTAAGSASAGASAGPPPTRRPRREEAAQDAPPPPKARASSSTSIPAPRPTPPARRKPPTSTRRAPPQAMRSTWRPRRTSRRARCGRPPLCRTPPQRRTPPPPRAPPPRAAPSRRPSPSPSLSSSTRAPPSKRRGLRSS